MVRSIATRTGDDGTTSLLYGQRVAKDHPQIEAVGSIDELTTALGAVKPSLPANERGAELRALITCTQKNLVALMGEVACHPEDEARYVASKFERLSVADVQRLDDAINTLEAQGLRFDGWATPGANACNAALEMARTTARRAERRLTALPAQGKAIRPELRQFLNRLSDLLWLLAREAEQ